MDYYSIRRDVEGTQSEVVEKKDEVEEAIGLLQDARDELENYEHALNSFIDALDDLENYSVSVDVQIDVSFDA